MKLATELLGDYLHLVRDAEKVSALFAEDGAIELPYLESVGMPWRVQGPLEIQAFFQQLLANIPDFAFKNIRYHIETPVQVFGEYDMEAHVLSTGRIYKQSYADGLWLNRAR